jgi:hypothetical protein
MTLNTLWFRRTFGAVLRRRGWKLPASAVEPSAGQAKGQAAVDELYKAACDPVGGPYVARMAGTGHLDLIGNEIEKPAPKSTPKATF